MLELNKDIVNTLREYAIENAEGTEIAPQYLPGNFVSILTCAAVEELLTIPSDAMQALINLYQRNTDIVANQSKPLPEPIKGVGTASVGVEGRRAILYMVLNAAYALGTALETIDCDSEEEEERFIDFVNSVRYILCSTKSEFLMFFVQYLITGEKLIDLDCILQIWRTLRDYASAKTCYDQIVEFIEETTIIKPYKEARRAFNAMNCVADLIGPAFEWFRYRKESEEVAKKRNDTLAALPAVGNVASFKDSLSSESIPLDKMPSMFHELATSNNANYRKDFYDAMTYVCNITLAMLARGADPNNFLMYDLTEEAKDTILRQCTLAHFSNDNRITFCELAASTISYAFARCLSSTSPYGLIDLLLADTHNGKALWEREEGLGIDMAYIAEKYDEDMLRRWYEKSLKAATEPLEKQISELKEKNETIKASHERKLKDAEKSYYAELARLKDMVKSFEAENQKLKKEKAELQELNESFFVPEENEEVEDPVQFSTYEKSIIFIGGNINVRNKMQEKYPDMTILDGTVPPAEAVLAGADLIILNTGCMSHLAFYKIISITKKRDIKIAYCKNYTNLQLLDQELARITKKHFGER